MAKQLVVPDDWQTVVATERQQRRAGRDHHQVGTAIKTGALHRLQGVKVAIQLLEQGTVWFHIGHPSQGPSWPRPSGEGALVGATHADEAARTQVTSQQLNPGAGHHTAHRKSENINGLLSTQLGRNVVVELGSKLKHGRQAKALGQVGNQQVRATSRQLPLEPVKQPRRVPEAMDQYERRGRCWRLWSGRQWIGVGRVRWLPWLNGCLY